MAPDDPKHDQAGDGRSARLRAEPGKVEMARLRLAAIDRTVFSAADLPGPDDHDRLIRQAVLALFDNG